MLPVQSFLNFIAQNQLFTLNDRLLVAVSGGRDSVVLAHLLKQAGFNFGIAHCNFQLRIDEAQAEQAFTSQLAAALNVPFHTISFDTQTYARQNGISTQMAARHLRYTWFEQIRLEHAYTYIAVAHHQNDSVETILLNLTRGTGIAGMHGILPQNGHIVRPLLFLSREDINSIVKQNDLQFMEDSSNASSKYARNKIRHQVIPCLKELNPRLEQTFDRNMERFRELELLLKHQLAQLEPQLMIPIGHEIHLDIQSVKNLYPQRLLLYGLLNPYGFSERVIGDLIASLDKHPGRTFESPGFALLLDREKLILSKRPIQPEPVFIHQNDHEVTYAQFRLTLLRDDSPLIIRDNPMALSVDADELSFPLVLRSWQEGDYFYPLGMKGKKKLSDFFVNEKIPLHQKTQIPILVNGNGDVIWVAGYRPDERYKVSEHTEKVIIFELYKLNL